MTKKENNEIVEVFVDGSFNKNDNQYGVGILMLNQQTKKIIFEKSYRLERINKKIQIHEWYAVIAGFQEIQRKGIEKAILHTDCNEIVRLLNGLPIKLNRNMQQTAEQVLKIYKKIKGIVLVKFLKSHTGNPFNERVDTLSRWASGTKKTNFVLLKDEKLNYDSSVFQCIAINQNIKVKENKLDISKNYEYILSKINQTNLPLKKKWIPWTLFCNNLQKVLSKECKVVKLSKLKKSDLFLKDFSVLHIGKTLCVKKK